MRHLLTFAAALALALPSAAVAAEKPMQFKLAAENNSGETGTATLLQGTKGVIVRLRLAGGGEADQPAHIHKGTCANLNPKPAFPLTTVKNGRSETTVKDVTLAELLKGGYAVNVHKSTTDIADYVACGNLVAAK